MTMAKDVSLRTLKVYWPVYFFVLPSALLVALFAYFPAASAFYHAFFRWNGEDINYYVGDLNFRQALGNYWLWLAVYALFMLTLILGAKKGKLGDNLKFCGGIVVPVIYIITAFVLKLTGDGRFVARSLIVSVAIWGGLLIASKLFFNSENDRRGPVSLILANFLCAGAISSFGVESILAWMVTILATGLFLRLSKGSMSKSLILKSFQAFAALGMAFCGLAQYSGGDPVIWSGFGVIVILVLFNVVKMIPSILTAVVINRLTNEKMSYIYKVCFVIPMIVPGMVLLLLWKFFFDPNIGFLNKILLNTGLLDLLVKMDSLLGWGGVFKDGVMPVWLGNEHLVLPAIIFWGFPWIGVVGVLIYLAGLEGISESIYEAADLDGAGPIDKFLHIELPLILTQVRINMVLMIIGTLQMYGFILVLFGDGGGPNGRLLVPGLFMFSNAFRYGNAGYACAIGIVIFAFILLLTELNNRYIRVEK